MEDICRRCVAVAYYNKWLVLKNKKNQELLEEIRMD